MPVCQSIGQHLLRLKWPHYCTFHFFWTTGCFSVSAAAHRTLFLCVKAGTWQNHSWESFHSSFPCASWGISLDYNSNSWSLCSVTTNSPVISDCPPIPLKESKQKKSKTRLDCDRCLDDTVSARYRGVSGGTYRAVSECVEKGSEMEKQFWTFLQLIYLNYLICKPQTNRSVCLGRGAPGGVLQNVTTHRCLYITMTLCFFQSAFCNTCTRQQGNQGMPAKAHFYAQETEYRSLSSLVLEGNGSYEKVEANEGSKLYGYICLSWGLSEKA